MRAESYEMQLCGFGKRRALDCTRAEGRASGPSRKEWLARHEVLVSPSLEYTSGRLAACKY